MLVRHSNDGKLYLYDVIDIKKKRAVVWIMRTEIMEIEYRKALK